CRCGAARPRVLPPGPVGDDTGAPLGWIAAQRWRLRVLRRDGPRLLGAALQTLHWALRPPPPHPSLALAEGQPIARPDAPNPRRRRPARRAVDPRGLARGRRASRGAPWHRWLLRRRRAACGRTSGLSVARPGGCRGPSATHAQARAVVNRSRFW